MKNAHIAFLCFPHHPHVYPTLAIVAALVRRGHRITYVTSDLFSPAVSDMGAETIHCPRFIDTSADRQERFANWFTLATRTLSQVIPFYENDRPDLVLYDRAFFAGRIVANKWSIPAITTSPALAFRSADVGCLSGPLRKWRAAEETIVKNVDDFFASHGIHEENAYFHDERLNIYLYPRIYQLEGSALDNRYFYAGRCAAERPCRGAWRPQASGRRPILLVSTSTAYAPEPGYFRMCIEALSRHDWHVLLSIGDDVDPACFGSLPENFEIVRGVPQIQILPHVALLICLGGPITTAEAMYHGVPLIMITHGYPDPEAYAENAVRLGIGVHLRKEETTAARVRELALQIVQDETLSIRVKQLQQIARREPGAEDTANRIEEHIEEMVS